MAHVIKRGARKFLAVGPIQSLSTGTVGFPYLTERQYVEIVIGEIIVRMEFAAAKLMADEIKALEKLP